MKNLIDAFKNLVIEVIILMAGVMFTALILSLFTRR